MVSVEIDGVAGKKSVQMGFTGQQLTAFGGMALWSGFLRKLSFREQLSELLPVGSDYSAEPKTPRTQAISVRIASGSQPTSDHPTRPKSESPRNNPTLSATQVECHSPSPPRTSSS